MSSIARLIIISSQKRTRAVD